MVGGEVVSGSVEAPPKKLTGYGKKTILTASGVSLIVGATGDWLLGVGVAIISVALDRSYWK